MLIDGVDVFGRTADTWLAKSGKDGLKDALA